MGRPKIKNPKNKQYRIRLTEEEYEKLKKLSIQEGVTMSELFRRTINILAFNVSNN